MERGFLCEAVECSSSSPSLMLRLGMLTDSSLHSFQNWTGAIERALDLPHQLWSVFSPSPDAFRFPVSLGSYSSGSSFFLLTLHSFLTFRWAGDDIIVANSSDSIWDPIQPHEIVAAGINNNSNVREFTVHSYQYNTCSAYTARSATAANLVNHRTISSFVDLMKKERLVSESVGAGFVVGEFNAVACESVRVSADRSESNLT